MDLRSCFHLFIAFTLFTLMGCPPKGPVCTEITHELGQKHVDIQSQIYHTPSQYLLTLKIDNREVNVIADTGSANLIVEGDKSICPTCTNPFYTPDVALASTHDYKISYGNGQASASVSTYKEDVGLACGPTVPYYIGVMTESKNVPSILGLAYQGIKEKATGVPEERTFFKQLTSATGMENAFYMQLCGVRPGSRLTLGADRTQVPGDLEYTSIVDESYYVVDVKSLTIDGQATAPWPANVLKDGPEKIITIVDSGTTLNLVPDAIHEQLKNVLNAAGAKLIPPIPQQFWEAENTTTSGYTIDAQVYTAEKIKSLPEIAVTLAGVQGKADVVVKIPPTVYLKNVGNDKLVFGFRGQQKNTNHHILGQVFMENALVFFDRDHKQIGFKSSVDLCK